MKRFALTICLAASLMLLLGVTAMAANSVVVQSRNVSMGATGVTIGVKLTNDVDLQAIVIPLIIREVTPGSFIATTGGLSGPPNGRVPGNRLALGTGALLYTKLFNRYAVPNPAASCKPGGFTALVASGYTGPWISPAAVMYVGLSADPTDPGDPPLLAGTDAGDGALSMTLAVTNVPGTFEIDTTCADPANHIVFTPVDPNLPAIIPDFTLGTEVIMANQCPIATAPTPVSATVGIAANNQIGATDPDVPPNPITYAMVAGSKGTVSASGLWSYTPTCADVPGFDVSIYVSDNQHAQDACATVTFHVNVTTVPLVVSGCANVSVHFGVLAVKDVTVSGGCPPYTFSGGAPGAVDANGHWTFESSCQSLGSQPVSITVTDATQQQKTCDFNLIVTNATVPACGTLADVVALIGVPKSVTLGPTTDADGDPLTYVQTAGPSWGSITGNVWTGTRPGSDLAAVNVCFTISDGCATAGPCCFGVLFEKPCLISIVDLDSTGHAINIGDYAQSLYGENHTVGVYFSNMPDSIGGFDLLICYDQSLLRFIGAARGVDLNPGWEYFTYRTGQYGGNCGSGCPNGYVKLVGIADMNNGVTPPAATFWLNGVIATLTFYVDANTTNIGLCAHIGFCSFDCTDNVLSSKSGKIAYFIMEGANLGPDWDSAVCFQGMLHKDSLKPVIAFGKFCPGAICIQRPHDDRGDINQNGVANEIGDAVLFSNYFIYGVNYAFPDPVRRQAQILSTDINNDGVTLTVADLVYLIRIITGDAQPYPPLGGGPKLSPNVNSVDVVSNVTDGALTVTTNASVDLGGALFVYRFSGLTVGTPVLTAGSNLQLKSNVDRGELRILVYGMASGARVPAGLNNLITVPVSGNGTIELAESQVADNLGAQLTVNATAKLQPTSYALLQNYPNPFNAGTVIQFSLKDPSSWNLTIYNIAGQVVRTFNGNGSGNVSVAWNGTAANGSSVASGMYFYRLNAKDFTATKKMVLMK